MDKRYQVFISSTYEDLHEERKEVIRALLELDCIPSGMELFPAADDDAWTLIRRVIDDTDYYVVISAGRYGSVHPETGIGFTEMEYDYAIDSGKPVLAFLHANLGTLSVDASETDPELREKLLAFHAKLRRKLVKEWNTSGDLKAAMSAGIYQAIKYNPALGWVRADERTPTDAGSKIESLKDEIRKLKSIIDRPKAHKKDLALTLMQAWNILHEILFDNIKDKRERDKIPFKFIEDILQEANGHLGISEILRYFPQYFVQIEGGEDEVIRKLEGSLHELALLGIIEFEDMDSIGRTELGRKVLHTARSIRLRTPPRSGP